MRRIAQIAIFAALLVAVSAMAADARSRPSQVTDPSADSPAGVIYSIPLDSARQDAAPHHTSSHSGGSGSAGGGAGPGGPAGPTSGGGAPSGGGADSGTGTGSGSSAGTAGSAGSGRGHLHPAASTGAAGGGASSANGNPQDLVPGGQPGSLVHSANGFGSSSEVPGAGAPLPPGLANAAAGTSSGPPIAVILALVVLGLGVYAGGRAWRPWRLWRRSSG